MYHSRHVVTVGVLGILHLIILRIELKRAPTVHPSTHKCQSTVAKVAFWSFKGKVHTVFLYPNIEVPFSFIAAGYRRVALMQQVQLHVLRFQPVLRHRLRCYLLRVDIPIRIRDTVLRTENDSHALDSAPLAVPVLFAFALRLPYRQPAGSGAYLSFVLCKNAHIFIY